MQSNSRFETNPDSRKYVGPFPGEISPSEVPKDAVPEGRDLRKELMAKILDRSALVGVVGMGYVGLPFAVEKAKMGYSVIGLDNNLSRVDQINRGENFIPDVHDAELKALVGSGIFRATTDYQCVADLDVIVIAVPTPLTKNLTPDLQYVERVTRELARRMRPGQLISLESTTYPGTTEEIMLPILQESGLKVEKDFFLAHSPERVDPGNKRFSTKNTTKVVGGVGPKSHEVAVSFYSSTIDNVVPVSSAKAAELVKVFENTFRAVNIALVNELTQLCDKMDLNVWEVLDAAFTKPFGIMPFYPGPGVGGHCIPLDPHYLEWKAKELNFNTRFISLAGEVNRSMPDFVIDKIIRVLEHTGKSLSAAKIAVLGVSYKKDVGDYRESPAVSIIHLLKKRGALVRFHDPYVTEIHEDGFSLDGHEMSAELLSSSDVTLILTDHSSVDYDFVVNHSKVVFDTRNITKKVRQFRERIILL